MRNSKDVAPSWQLFNKSDLQGMLELLNATNDINLQIKLFSALSAYLMFNKEANLDVIIKSSAVYDRIHNVLAKGLLRKTTDALNFLSVLLYVDAEVGTTKRRSLALYAKNMTRTSGCLGAMTDMFANCMMYHDTWKALCQCLAIACSGCENNQSYCTHLIPVCIQKCSQMNIDIFLVLQSLILNHNRNIQLFLDCNGTAIFTRELLHYDKSLQLLTTVVQCSNASLLLRKTKVLDDLQDFLRLYGPGSQIGQKAMIILNHIKRSRGMDSHISRNINEKQCKKIECRDDIMTSHKVGNELYDTRTLMQNVMKEVFKYKQEELGPLQKAVSKVEVNSLIRGASAMNLNSRNRQIRLRNVLNKTKKLMEQHLHTRLHRNISTEKSFSFLENKFNHIVSRHNSHHRNGCNYDRSLTNIEDTKTQTMTNIENHLPDFYKVISEEKSTLVDLKDFRPVFSSTPKHEGESSNEIFCSKIDMSQSNVTTRQLTQQRTTKVQKRRPKIVPRNRDKDLRNRSISSRLFSAINESCTTLVKTVANIFKKKKPPVSSKDSTSCAFSSPVAKNQSCSFSFFNYMQKRDAILNKKTIRNRNKNSSYFSLGTKSCETCDNTEVLKRKLANDEHLKQTVKKLKLGINLYGCDFKKISRTMWPRESYMTPVVLYNLYRKLLIK